MTDRASSHVRWLAPGLAFLTAASTAASAPPLFFHRPTEIVEASLSSTQREIEESWLPKIKRRSYARLNLPHLDAVEALREPVETWFNLLPDVSFTAALEANDTGRRLKVRVWQAVGNREGLPVEVRLLQSKVDWELYRLNKSRRPSPDAEPRPVSGTVRYGQASFRIRALALVPGIVAVEELLPDPPDSINDVVLPAIPIPPLPDQRD